MIENIQGGILSGFGLRPGRISETHGQSDDRSGFKELPEVQVKLYEPQEGLIP